MRCAAVRRAPLIEPGENSVRRTHKKDFKKVVRASVIRSVSTFSSFGNQQKKTFKENVLSTCGCPLAGRPSRGQPPASVASPAIYDAAGQRLSPVFQRFFFLEKCSRRRLDAPPPPNNKNKCALFLSLQGSRTVRRSEDFSFPFDRPSRREMNAPLSERSFQMG